jgi:cell division septation protein DedD
MGAKKQDKGKAELTTEVVSEDQPEAPGEEYTIPDDDTPSEQLLDTSGTQKQPESKPEPTPPPVTKQEEPKSTPVTAPVEAPAKKTTTSTPATTNKATENTGGTHLVIAGNFLTRANAEERVKELKKLGYSNAEVVNFELSEYHTACAGRYTDLNEARRIAKKIKDMNGIDTYVRHGN